MMFVNETFSKLIWTSEFIFKISVAILKLLSIYVRSQEIWSVGRNDV